MFKEFLNVANEEELLGGKPFQTFTTRSLKSVTKGDGETDRQNGCSVYRSLQLQNGSRDDEEQKQSNPNRQRILNEVSVISATEMENDAENRGDMNISCRTRNSAVSVCAQ